MVQSKSSLAPVLGSSGVLLGAVLQGPPKLRTDGGMGNVRRPRALIVKNLLKEKELAVFLTSLESALQFEEVSWSFNLMKELIFLTLHK